MNQFEKFLLKCCIVFNVRLCMCVCVSGRAPSAMTTLQTWMEKMGGALRSMSGRGRRGSEPRLCWREDLEVNTHKHTLGMSGRSFLCTAFILPLPSMSCSYFTPHQKSVGFSSASLVNFSRIFNTKRPNDQNRQSIIKLIIYSLNPLVFVPN